MKPLLVQAFSGESLVRPPVWLMRQAGRYLPEYRALKEQHSFLELCRSAELAVEVTLQPLRRFPVDAAIVFADILLPASRLGFDIDFAPGPIVRNKISSALDIKRLVAEPFNPKSDPTCCAIGMLKQIFAEDTAFANRAVIGFAAAPWTLACYLLEQGPFKHFVGSQVFAAEQPEAFRQLMLNLTEILSDFLLAQIESGADVIQIFDSWAGNLNANDYQSLALPYLQQLIENVRKSNCPNIVYASGSSHLLPLLAKSGSDGISIDSKCALSDAEKIVGPDILLQGNLDPAHLFFSPGKIAEEVAQIAQSISRRSRYIANLGHGVLQGTPVTAVSTFIDAVQNSWKQ